MYSHPHVRVPTPAPDLTVRGLVTLVLLLVAIPALLWTLTEPIAVTAGAGALAVRYWRR